MCRQWRGTFNEGRKKWEAPALAPPLAPWSEALSPWQADSYSGYKRAEPKVGRNDPCPSGSGTKYKKCCGGWKSDVFCTFFGAEWRFCGGALYLSHLF